MSVCPTCRCPMAADLSGEWICMECGYVEEGDTIVEPEITPVTFQPIQNNRYSRIPRETFTLVNTLSDTLQLSKEDKRKSKAYFKALNNSDGSWPSGTTGKLRAMACIYFAVKHKRPLSLTKMAHDCQVSLPQFGKAIKQYELILKEYDLDVEDVSTRPNCPSLYIEKCCASLKPAISAEDRVNIIKRCKFLIELAAKNFILDGRNPLGIAAAVIFFSLESLHFNKYVTASGRKHICKELDISVYTANERYKEIQALLLKKANTFFPWGVTEKELANNYDDLERILINEIQESTGETTETAEPNTLGEDDNDVKEDVVLPRSFIVAKQARAIRQEKVNRAKERIQSTMKENKIEGLLGSEVIKVDYLDAIEEENSIESHNEVEKWDNEDLLIESLLLKGVPEDAILDGYYNCGLEISRPILHDIDSENLNDEDITEEELASYLTGYKRANPEKLPSLPSKKFCL